MPRFQKPSFIMSTIPCGATLLVAPLASGDVYEWMNDASSYGYLSQLSIPNELAEESCAPTSATNMLVHMQNTHQAAIGSDNPLVGDGYDGWISTAETLQGFFGTNNDEGSSGPGQTAGLERYLESIGVADRFTFDAVTFEEKEGYPTWATQGTTPTFGDFYGWLSAGAGVYLDIIYEDAQPGGVQGHALALVGLEWNDANEDGVVDISEGATLAVIDPLDPSQNYDGSDVLGPPKLTSISIWQDESDGPLQFSYLQYHGGLPFEPGNYEVADGFIGGGIALSVTVPGPAAGLVAAAIGLARRRRR